MTITLPTAKTHFQFSNSKLPTRTATTTTTTTNTSTATLPPTPTITTITTTRFTMRTTSPSPRDTTKFATLKRTSSSSSLDHSCHVLRNNHDDDDDDDDDDDEASTQHDLSSTNNILPQDLPPCCPIDDNPQTTTSTHAFNVMTTATIATNRQNPPGHEKKNHNTNIKSLSSSSSSRKRKSHQGKQSRQDAKRFPKRFKWNDDAANVFCPLDRKACTLLRNEDYILSFVVVEADRSMPNHPTYDDSGGGDIMLSMLRSGRLEDLLFCNCHQEHQRNFLKEKEYKEAEQEEKKQQEKEEEESRCRDTAATTARQSNAATPWNLNLIQQLTRILIDAMGFQIQDRQTRQQQQEGSNSNDNHGSSDYILQPMEDKVPLERPSSIKNLVDLQIAILKSSSSTSSSSSSSLLECRIMEDIALAYRLAAYFMLKACHEWNKQSQQEQPQPEPKPKRRRQKNKKNESHNRKVKTMKKVQNRAALTLFVSLRSLYVDLFLRPSSTNHTMDDEKMSCPVSKNICNFFCVKEKRTGLTPAQVLLIDCGTLLTDVEDGGVGMIDHKRCMTLVEKILKLDKEFGEVRGLDLGGEWGGIMELLLRQLLVTESVFVGNNGPIQKYLEKLNQRHQAVSGALASVLLDMTQQCKIAMEEILELRRVQLDRMAAVRTIMMQQHLSSSSRVLHPLYDQNLASRDAMMSEDMHKLRMHGCIYLTKVFAVYASQHQRPNHLGGQLLRDHVEQMAFYLFHFLMENDPSSQNPEEGSVHPFSVAARVNVKSAALAALYLSTKINDCPISMRRLIALSKTVNGDFILKNFEGTESDVPYQNLIKTYERHLMLLHGYDAPEMSCLPFGHTSKVEELFHLNPNEYEKYLHVFQHMGYKLSSCCLLDDPLLVAVAVYNFGCKYLNVLPIPCDWDDSLEETDYKIVEILSDYMNTAYKFYAERSESMFQPSNSTPELLKKDTLCSLPSLIDQIQHTSGRNI